MREQGMTGPQGLDSSRMCPIGLKSTDFSRHANATEVIVCDTSVVGHLMRSRRDRKRHA